MKKYHCIESNCNNIVKYSNRRCRYCAHKIENLNSKYFTGKTLKKYYCKCGNEICYKTWRYGNRTCQFCANKGKNHPFYSKHHTLKTKIKMSLAHGGTGIPYENNNYPEEYFRIRYWILKRDNYTCQLCFEYGNDVHHIDYNKQNCEEENLISLCTKCNIRANFNRDYWLAYFTYIEENKVCLQ